MMRSIVLALSVLAACKAGDACVAPTGPAGAGCEAFYCGPALATDWMSAQLSTGFCTVAPPEQAGQLYSMCSVIGSSPYECTGIAAGHYLCVGSSLTALCEHDADCPAGTRCDYDFGFASFGTCEKTCTAPGNGDCGRCDRACDTTVGLCVRLGTDYPTNIPCDSTHPAIAVTLALPELYSRASLTLTVPGANPVVLHLDLATTMLTVAYPVGATAGDATLAFEGDGPGVDRLGGGADFQSDPTKCTAVTVHVSVTQGIPDAGP